MRLRKIISPISLAIVLTGTAFGQFCFYGPYNESTWQTWTGGDHFGETRMTDLMFAYGADWFVASGGGAAHLESNCFSSTTWLVVASPYFGPIQSYEASGVYVQVWRSVTSRDVVATTYDCEPEAQNLQRTEVYTTTLGTESPGYEYWC